MTEKYRELNLALEFLDAIDTTELSEENAGNVIEAHGYLSTWLEDNTELPQQFEVGEYKVCGTTKNVYKVDENPLTEMKPTKFYVAHENRFVKMTLHENVIARDKKATDEQIALFKRAEHFASKGRKLDEFRVGDVVYIHLDGSKAVVKELRKHLVVLSFKYTDQIYPAEILKLIKTAEELKGV